ncbi:hypothetical protein N7494_012498 [Penicillium frequentans]|uniref:Transcription factor domain-containing protein n=1 Tax=Penicillium frequentans TaxID=3151616 RepID=A0AAD6CMH8_9EURO|nr:hypothetical protein N7494_012498 [Penicillium glabrum]
MKWPPQRTNAEHSAAIALTNIARTSKTSEVSGKPSSHSNISQEAGAPINDTATSVKWRHTPAAHKLVMWPSIKILLHPHEYNQDYLMRSERQRKPTYTSDLRDVSFLAEDTILSTSSLAHGGAGGRSKSIPNETSIVHAEALTIDSCIEIDQSGVFKLSEKTSRRYYQSYLDHVHKLHPFLDEQELDLKVEAFIRCYSPPEPTSTTGINRCHAGIEAIKGPGHPSSPGQFVEPNIDNAIILLIFAVGAICDNESPISSPSMSPRTCCCHLPRIFGPVRQATLGDSTQTVNDVFSPAPLYCTQKDTVPLNESLHTPSKCSSFSASTSNFGEHGSRRMTDTGSEGGNATYQPVVPGLALYRVATATIGCLKGAFNLKYVQACLLAGIYAGQFADPFRSHVWISEAARACQLFLQRPLCKEGHTKELFNFAYWSCLQLESDLLAELDIPASGMSRYEYCVSLPKRRYPMNGPDGLISPSTIMMMYYYSQIQLQKIRNYVHTTLYEIKNQGQASCSPYVQKVQVVNLGLWRCSLPLPLQWEDTDGPAKDINAAHMRARYYRTEHILHLPLLYYALHYGKPGTWDKFNERISVDSQTDCTYTLETQLWLNYPSTEHMLSAMDSDTSNDSWKFPQHWVPPTFGLGELPPVVRRACKACVECAIQGLTAFDGIEGRLVVPNISGTAHEQFGYMLVLSATYNSSLSELVDHSTLDRLFKRTICFLLQSENNSPTLRADIRILEDIYSKLFRRPSTPTDT